MKKRKARGKRENEVNFPAIELIHDPQGTSILTVISYIVISILNVIS